jgi:hypothetical protein
LEGNIVMPPSGQPKHQPRKQHHEPPRGPYRPQPHRPAHKKASQAAAQPSHQAQTPQYPQYQPSAPPPTHRRSLWDRIWKDPNGRIVLWQTPNPWLIAWAVLTTLSLFFTGRMADILTGLASASLIAWALLEVFRGVNYFRRGLGLIVLLYSLAALVKSF